MRCHIWIITSFKTRFICQSFFRNNGYGIEYYPFMNCFTILVIHVVFSWKTCFLKHPWGFYLFFTSRLASHSSIGIGSHVKTNLDFHFSFKNCGPRNKRECTPEYHQKLLERMNLLLDQLNETKMGLISWLFQDVPWRARLSMHADFLTYFDHTISEGHIHMSGHQRSDGS